MGEKNGLVVGREMMEWWMWEWKELIGGVKGYRFCLGRENEKGRWYVKGWWVLRWGLGGGRK